MILDKIENLHLYAGVNKFIGNVVEFINTHDLREIPQGRVEICGGDCFANFCVAHGRTKEEAVMESHNKMIDIQIVLESEEALGFAPRCELPETQYNEEGDCSLYPGQQCRDYFKLRQGEFHLFLPGDAHAPLITPTESYRKVIFKLRVD